MSDWETVIGLEVHIQLATNSKMFSGSATAFGAEANTQACPLDLALPGTLPVANGEAINMAIKFGLAIDAKIGMFSQFVRKNYFYPDLPKGYQISQLEYPIVGEGSISIDLDALDTKEGKEEEGDKENTDKGGTSKVIGITRAHLEEDAGKSLHEDFHGMSGIDYNRAGTPLMEIVSEPDLRSAQEAVAYLKAINMLVRYLGISDGDMSQGSMRCDVNISIRKASSSEFGQRAEIKNVNSYRFVEKAINYEVARQIDIVEEGKEVVQETRLYDAEKNETRSMRSKEEAHDYRYFPDPDLLPVTVTQQQVDEIRNNLVELPHVKRERFKAEYSISDYEAKLLVTQKQLADYYEEVQQQCRDSKLASSWVISELLGALNKEGLDITASPVTSTTLGQVLIRIKDGTISGKIAKDIFQELWQKNGGAVDAIIEKRGLRQISDEGKISEIVAKVVQANLEQANDYRNGKDKLLGYFVGQVMKETQGKADPGLVNKLLLAELNKA